MLWDLGLDAWMIQDGNHGDFEKGQFAEFAIGFLQQADSTQTPKRTPEARLCVDASYEVVGLTLLQTGEFTLVDVGLLIFGGSTDLVVNQWFEMRMALDCFADLEQLSHIAEAPPLVYSWRIESILLEGKEILRTDAWNDAGGNGSYILRCERLPVAPRHPNGTAAP